MISADQLAETEYAAVSLPGKVRQTPIGRFVHDKRFPERQDANQLFDARVPADGQTEFFETLEHLYAPLKLPFKKLCGHKPNTFTSLVPALQTNGYTLYKIWMMTQQRPSQLASNPKVHIKVVDSSTSQDFKDLWYEGVYPYIVTRDSYLGGETLIAYLDDHPIGTTGWFIVNGIARFRAVYVLESYRNQGIASTMIHYVQNHPTVKQQAALTIHVEEDGPLKLYERLGFEKHSPFWEAVKRTD